MWPYNEIKYVFKRQGLWILWNNYLEPINKIKSIVYGDNELPTMQITGDSGSGVGAISQRLAEQGMAGCWARVGVIA